MSATMTRAGIIILVVLVHSIGLYEVVAQARPGNAKPQKWTVPAHPKGKTGRVLVAPKPIILPTHEMQFSRVGASKVWPKHYRDSLLAFPQLFWLEPGSLLFRRLPTDTVFLRIALEPPPFPFNENYFIEGNMCLLHQDLNHDGVPEALVGFWRGWEHGHGSRVALNLIDVSGTPRLLLSAIIQIKEEGWATDSDIPDSGDKTFFTSGWERSVRLEKEDILLLLETGHNDGLVKEVKPLTATPYLRIGSLVHHGYENHDKSKITPLTPGRYHYRNGHLVWMGK
ncbi:hypothetical protein [Hymenobacter properus]|uniref:Uncharacterized protein n=1 Tax=Hymenobacter properus TaxID=2791026 RepID=A0A931BLS1_9BACT|nr:hypothetical protein [Hymenobacter properus]MBF9141790.1 hypothetical protein [Hymenobacter properus]MBR7720598.1 hypothetical protein [Microvirga sp. SRT04]